MNIFVAFFLLLILLAQSTPPAASSIPLIGAYYCLNMILIALSTCLSVIIVNIYFHGNHTRLPIWLKRLLVNYLAPPLFLGDFVRGMIGGGARVATPARTIYASDQNHDVSRKQSGERWPMLANGSVVERSGSKTAEDVLKEFGGTIEEYERLEDNVREIKNTMGMMMGRVTTKEARMSIGTEWKTFAIVVDRIFFILYLICIIASSVTIFGQAGKTKADLDRLFENE